MRTKSEQRRTQILHVAAAAFTELGVDNTTMSDIVARMGGSKSTIYSYFPSKADLVQAVVAHSAEAALQAAFAQLHSNSAAIATLHQFGRTYLMQLLKPEMVSALRIAQQDGSRSDIGKRFHDTGPAVGWALVQDWLAGQLAAGKLVDCDTRVAAMHLKGLLQSELLEQAMFGLAVPDAAIVEQVADRAIDTFLRAYSLH